MLNLTDETKSALSKINKDIEIIKNRDNKFIFINTGLITVIITICIFLLGIFTNNVIHHVDFAFNSRLEQVLKEIKNHSLDDSLHYKVILQPEENQCQQK